MKKISSDLKKSLMDAERDLNLFGDETITEWTEQILAGKIPKWPEEECACSVHYPKGKRCRCGPVNDSGECDCAWPRWFIKEAFLDTIEDEIREFWEARNRTEIFDLPLNSGPKEVPDHEDSDCTAHYWADETDRWYCLTIDDLCLVSKYESDELNGYSEWASCTGEETPGQGNEGDEGGGKS